MKVKLGDARKSQNRSHFDTDEMTVIFKSLKGISVPTAAEERELLRKAKSGDTEARKELVWRNMPMVIKEASRMVRRHTSVSTDKIDILQSALSEGSMGLCRAIAAFDMSRENKFSTYAMWHIKESIRRALVFDKNSVKPIRTLERSRDVNIAITMMSFIEDFDKADEDDGDSVTENLHKKTVIKEMMAAMSEILSKKECYILQNRYGFHGSELTYSDMANMLGISTERVRQLENNALRKLWTHLRRNEMSRLNGKSASAVTDEALMNLLARR